MTDVIIIGCGGGGAVIAKELVEQGLEVLALEAGPYFENRNGPTAPATAYEDLDADRLDEAWTAVYWDMTNPATGKLRWGPADPSRPAYSRIYEGRMMNVNQVAAVGGTTTHYVGACPRPFSWPAEAPVTIRQLQRYFDWVEATLPVTEWDEPQACKDEITIKAARRLGLDAHYSRLAINPGSFNRLPRNPTDEDFYAPNFSGCVACGHCILGCHHPLRARVEDKAKRATNVSYLPQALRTGRLEVRPGCVARRVEVSNGAARGVTYRDPSGREVTEEAQVVVLAAGAIESPRLWLNSRLPNGNGLDGPVGRYLTTHQFEYVGALFPFEIDRFKGPTEASEVVVPGGGKFGALGAEPAFIAMTSFSLRNRRRVWGSDMKRYMEDYRRSLSLTLMVDDEAHPDNRVTLERTRPPDDAGLIPRIRYVPTATTVANSQRLVQAAMDVLREAGARPDTVFNADMLGLTAHPMGTMRMGSDPATSVVNADCRSHAVDRLYVADNSVLPSSLGGANPTLTTQALATRTAERLAAAHFGISAWVDD